MGEFTVTRKMLGDAGEHYALSQLTFAGLPAVKMPDGWKGYDLAVHSSVGLVSVSVKTRSETEKWKAGSWFMFDHRRTCDWIIFNFQTAAGRIRSWIMPFEVAQIHANNPPATRKDQDSRYISWAKLNRDPLAKFENNWQMHHAFE